MIANGQLSVLATVTETFRNGGHFVAVAHPHVQQRFAVCGPGVFHTADKRAVGWTSAWLAEFRSWTFH
jgi:hypothetical protein